MILFTADWHIKLGQKNVPRKWALARYREFFKQVHAIKCDTHIIGGDIFDRLPSMAELQLYFEFIAGVIVPTIIYDGNHEATRKNATFLSFLADATQKINSLVEIVTTSTEYETYGILPYADLHRPDAIEQFNGERPLFTHVRGEIPPHVKSEVVLERFERFPIVYAGDLHAHSNSQRNIVYPGSPLTTTFHRTEVKTGYILIDSNCLTSWTWHEFELPQLIRKTVDNPDDMIATDYHHTIYELEGDMQDLASVKNTDLLDKKVIKRSTETALELTSNMTIADEVIEYLLYILELNSSKVKNIMGIYHDYT